MLPESKFPVTGGIMQTEEVVPRARSTGLVEDSASDLASHLQAQSLLRFPQQSQYSSPTQLPPTPSTPLTFTLNMAVKQEPQEDDESVRQSSTLSPQMEIDEAQSVPDAALDHLSIPSQASQEAPENIQSSQQLQAPCRKPASRGRRKSRWKLKFHHQALPPEYLDHYEAALAQEAALTSSSATASPAPESHGSPPTQDGGSSGGDVQTWLQRLAAMQNDVYPKSVPSQQRELCQTTASRRSVITSTQASPLPSPAGPLGHLAQQPQRQDVRQPSVRPPMKYSDLPYMGEITLDNSKPRRGRKPKKADICHLIYKNYGTILPGTPGLEERPPKPAAPGKLELGDAVQLPPTFQRTDIQNRISSLLEKRLTQERRAYEVSLEAASGREQHEPLNLCVRDVNLLKIRLADRQIFGSRSEGSSDFEDIEFLGSLANACRPSLESNGSALISHLEADARNGLLESNNNQLEKCIGDSNGIGVDPTSSANNNCTSNSNESVQQQQPGSDLLYWPNAGVFVHPAALQSQFLYYQKLAQEKALAGSGESGEQSSPREQRIVPKSIYSMLENAKSEAGSAETSAPAPPSPRAKRSSGAQSQSASPATKRKRSAIFIPPMPTENNNNPTTEVSICKFKFTGGAKPTLQEKKSLSVDSGGNFRYYSGTGDKSMRGYEFFPREALQQQANAAAAAAVGVSQGPSTPGSVAAPVDCSLDADSRRKRKTRKSMQREKLEQTFKEKGFLIQTQQLESAEGATYCKFRQLRKFTRYLFRSWKDYLPGNVRELNESGEPVTELKELEPDAEGSSPSPLPAGNLELPPVAFVEGPAPSLTLLR